MPCSSPFLPSQPKNSLGEQEKLELNLESKPPFLLHFTITHKNKTFFFHTEKIDGCLQGNEEGKTRPCFSSSASISTFHPSPFLKRGTICHFLGILWIWVDLGRSSSCGFAMAEARDDGLGAREGGEGVLLRELRDQSEKGSAAVMGVVCEVEKGVFGFGFGEFEWRRRTMVKWVWVRE